jgi:broad specificity phosphatase PhoE
MKKEIAEERFDISNVRVYCSPFSRTMDTAKAVADVMEIDASKFQVFCLKLKKSLKGITYM